MKVQAPIVAVTVYPDRARVTRRGTVDLEVGTHELVVSDLTLLLDPDSLRATGEGTAQVRLLGVDVRREYLIETPSERAAELTEKLQAKEDADQVFEDEIARLDSQMNTLDSLGEHAGENLARGIGRGRAKVQDGKALLSFIGTQSELLQARKRTIATEQRELSKEIEALEKELNRIANERPRERYEATVGIDALTAGTFTVELEYTTTRGASWQPLYDLRLLDDKEIEISYLAQVQQSTGEDWDDIDLTLSTARPAVSADLPELSPWYLRVYQPLPPPAPRGLRRKAMAATPLAEDAEEMAEVELFFSAGAAPAPEPAVAQAVQAEVDTGGAAVTYHIPRQADVPADGTPSKITVGVLSLEPKLDYLTVPKLVGEVFRRAKVKNDSEYTFLPGPVSLFYGNEFVGRASLPKVAPQEEIETTMGLDDRITVERDLVLQEVGKQFIGDRRVHRYAYEIVVQNLLPTEANVLVRDQLPVSAHEEIKIKTEELLPPPDREGEQGELSWKLVLQPQEKRTVRIEFTVTAPRGVTLVGLPED